MTEQKVIAAANVILADLTMLDFQDEAINWADLRCVEARQYAGKDGAWTITVEEADPGAQSFCREIENRLFQCYRIRADVHTEW